MIAAGLHPSRLGALKASAEQADHLVMMEIGRATRVNPGAAIVVGAVVVMVSAAALQSAGLLLFGICGLVGSLAYRSMRSAESDDIVEPRHLDLSWPRKLAILAVLFAVFSLLAWFGTR